MASRVPRHERAVAAIRSVRRCSRRRHEVRAVDDVSLESCGRVPAIVGESGSGKTTLANLILGVYPPSGEMRLRGEALPARRTLR